MKPFGGLTAEVFAAYSPEKWASNVHNLPRMRAKDAMLALCESAQAKLAEELSGLDRGASDEVPNISNHKKVDAQWVYWFRDQAARAALAKFLEKTPLVQEEIFNLAAYDKHACVVVVVRQNDLWLGLRIGAQAVVDRRNAAAKLQKAWERETMLAYLAELPEGAVLGKDGAVVNAAGMNLDSLEEHSKHLGEKDSAWIVGHSVQASEAIELGVDLADYVARWLGACIPIYRFLAWTRDNDHIDVVRQLAEDKAQKRRQATGFNPGDRVRIVSGLFAGKTGVVQDVDTKAQVKIRVGKMAVVVAGTDLTPAS
jgi:hypothetical protein